MRRSSTETCSQVDDFPEGQRSRPGSPDEVVLVVVGADHVHAAGVDQGRDAARHAGAEDVLGSCGRESVG